MGKSASAVRCAAPKLSSPLRILSQPSCLGLLALSDAPAAPRRQQKAPGQTTAEEPRLAAQEAHPEGRQGQGRPRARRLRRDQRGRCRRDVGPAEDAQGELRGAPASPAQPASCCVPARCMTLRGPSAAFFPWRSRPADLSTLLVTGGGPEPDDERASEYVHRRADV